MGTPVDPTSSPASGFSNNVLKVREDAGPISFTMDAGKAVITSGPAPPWADDATLDRSVLRERIEPWLSALFQADHLNLLIGSGLTTALEYEACGNAGTAMTGGRFTTFATEIAAAAERLAGAAGRRVPNIEDELRAALQLLRGIEILGHAHTADLQRDVETVIKSFADSILETEQRLAAKPHNRAFGLLVSFLMSFASRPGGRDRLGLFTTNYDRVIEFGAELAGLHLLDRFVGVVAPVFRSSRLDLDLHYNPPGIRGEPRFVEGVARFTKLHGSLDWVSNGENIRRFGLPFGAESIDPYLRAPGLSDAEATALMIYPNASKDRETAEYPYVELFRDLATAVARPSTVTVTYGYSFGDEHINRVLRDSLTIPSTHLVIMSYDDKLGRIFDAYNNWNRPSQMTLLIGSELAGLETLVTHYLPKPALDMATKRMGALLRERIGNSRSVTTPAGTSGGTP